MGQMKELFIQMQEAYLQGAYLEKEAIDKLVNVEEFNPNNEKHVEIMQETQQAIKENSYGEE